MKKILAISLLFTLLLIHSAQAEDEISFIKQAYSALSHTPQTGNQLDLATLEQVRTLFDYSAFFKKTLIDIQEKMSPEEVEDFKRTFAEVLFQKIAKKGLKVSEKKLEKIHYKLESRSEGISVATVTGVSGKTQVTLKFELLPFNDSWRIQDIAINGALMTRNYRGQFNRIYRVEGFAGLKDRMEKKKSKT